MNILNEERFIKYLIENDLIEQDKLEIYQYGLHLLIKKIFYASFILAVGLWGDETCGIIFFLICYINIREYSGGYHAKTNFGCCICTICVTIFALGLQKVMKLLSDVLLILIMLSCVCIIWKLSPQEAVTNPLEEKQIVTYRKKTQKNAIIFVAISLLGYLEKGIFRGITCAFICQALMLIIRKMEKGN